PPERVAKSTLPIKRRPTKARRGAKLSNSSIGGDSMLTPEELQQVLPAETSFPAPIPTQCVSSDEYMPCPQTEKQKEFEARIKEYGAELARQQGVSRRTFFKSAAGMAAAFVAMNDT